MLLPENARRLAIFAYYDEDGLVDDYVPYLLERVGAFCETQIVVVNGTLTPESEAKLRPFATRILYRANEGFDVTAYKEGVLGERAHWPQYDEVLFYNQTIFGPVCPLEPMFTQMAARDVDFWGLTRHKGAPAAVWDESIAIPPHVQSFFFAVRGEMLRSEAFARYWEELPPIRSYWDAVGKHEIRFTAHFAALGFCWDTYVDTAALEQYNDYPLMGMPALLLREQGCPFFKRKSFLTPRCQYTTTPQGEAPRALYEYLRDETDYPLALVAQNLARTVPAAQAAQAMTPYFDVCAERAQSGNRYAAVLYLRDEPMAGLMAERIARLSAHADCFVLCAGEALAEQCAPVLGGAARVLVADRPGPRFLFEKLWDTVRGYPYLLYLSNDMPLALAQFLDATSLALALEGIAQPQCAAILDRNPIFGVLLPPPSGHQDTVTLGAGLPRRRKEILRLLGTGGMRPAIDGSLGLASRGGMFFARTGALAGLAQMDWDEMAQEELFEGLYPDWELLVPLAAQSAGYLTGYATTARRAFVEWETQKSMLSDVLQMWSTERKNRYDQVNFRMKAIKDFYYERRFQMTLEQAFAAKLSFKQKMWICLQILLSPAAFQKLRRLLGRADAPPPPPEDPLD